MDDSPVWAVGDKCLSPYSGDGKLYSGKISTLKRSAAGIFATVRFDGYGEDDSEDVDVKKLKLVPEKHLDKEKLPKRDTSGGLFSPLQGGQPSNPQHGRYDSDDEEDCLLLLKTERLSGIILEDKLNKSVTPSSHNRKTAKKNCHDDDDHLNDDREIRTPRRRKPKLEILGGQAKYPEQELSSRKLSDLSSNLEERAVKKALTSPTSDNTTQETDTTNENESDITDKFAGFDDDDLTKPKFSYQPESAKIAMLLSQEGESPVVEVPANLNQFLRDYQREGIRFLYDHFKQNRGAILGDDMGLGKTIQVIGFISALLGKKGDKCDVLRQKPRFIRELSDTVYQAGPYSGPFLIIGPGCVLYNWLEELDTWGHFSVRKFHGSDKDDCLREVRRGKVEIVVTTFETFRDHQESLNSVDWTAVIVDEVHKIKELNAKATQALRKIPTPRRFGLTGTALQNNLKEFFSILDWARPGCLGRLQDFETDFVKPMELGQRHDANKRELAMARRQKERLADIRKGMMIRRLKTLISDQLPKKDDSVVFCRLSQLQTSIYKTILSHPHMASVLHSEDPCVCDSGQPQGMCCNKTAADGISVKSLRFTFMHLLLKTANHVALLIPTLKTSERQVKTAQEICKIAFKNHPEFVTQTCEAAFRTLSDPKYCGKMKVLQGLLNVFSKDYSKVLIFSYATQVLDIIEQYLMSTGYEYRRIDGTVSSKRRMVVVREFNTDPNIFICLISTKAGGLGLNLTGANKVVIFDPNWNPTHDLQAQDRAYRIGQRRDVQVYRLVSTGTIEENMYLRQIYKQQLLNVTVEDTNARRYFYAVQGSKHQKGELFGIKNMFSLRTGEACFTRDILKRNERVESALEGFETVQYIPPVVRVEDDEEYEDVVHDETSHDNQQPDHDILAQFFSEQDSDDVIDYTSDPDNKDSIPNPINQEKGKTKLPTHAKENKRKAIEIDNEEENTDDEDNEEKLATSSKTHTKVTFEHRVGGKVKPNQSKTGKGPLKRKGPALFEDKFEKEDHFQIDQTLAGTFADVSDVFDDCGVVHIHQNVKVVGGSRAEDHMTKCAISDVYELHQNSQDLAVQCEPLQMSSDDEKDSVQKVQGRGRRAADDINAVRSEVTDTAKVLIGQTPRAFKMRQIEEMRKLHAPDLTIQEFATQILCSNIEERMALLKQYYTHMHPELEKVFKNPVGQSSQKVSSKNRPNIESATGEGKRKVCKTNCRNTARKSSTDITINDTQRLMERTKRPNVARNVGINYANDNEEEEKNKVKECESDKEEEMIVGRNVTPKRKGKANGGNSSVKSRSYKEHNSVKPGLSKHTQIVPTYLTLDNEENEEVKSQVFRRRKHLIKAGSSEDPAEILEQLANQSEDLDNDDGQLGGNIKAEITASSVNKETDTSVLDDLFTTSSVLRKPPPKKKDNMSPNKKILAALENKAIVNKPDQFDPFKEVDEIFTGSESGHSSMDCDIGVNLETSTLKDDNVDCFDDPKFRKKKLKKEVINRRNIVDHLIAESEAEFADLFAQGKLKKKAQNETQKSVNSVDGSLSLFD